MLDVEHYLKRLRSRDSSSGKKQNDTSTKRRVLQPINDNTRNIAANVHKTAGAEAVLKPKIARLSKGHVDQPKELPITEATTDKKLKRDTTDFASELQDLRPKKRARTASPSPHRLLVLSLHQRISTLLGIRTREQGNTASQLCEQDEDEVKVDIPEADEPMVSEPLDDNETTETASNQVWVMKWIDYTQKFGLGYVLSNHITGVCFNDHSKILLEPKRQYVDPSCARF